MELRLALLGIAVSIALAMAPAAEAAGWTIQPTPNPSGAINSHLYDVSCPSASACVAVGDYENSLGIQVTLAEVWNLTGWTIQSTPNPTGARGSFLTGVSCTSASACTAVGFYVNSARTQVPLAERWNGLTWTIQLTPSPAGATASHLNGVSCTLASACTAVGAFDTAGGVATLAESWSGTGWTIQSTRNRAGGDNYMYDVSCSAAGACTGVGVTCPGDTWTGHGFCIGSQLTLVERWDGTSWTIQSTPNEPGAVVNYLSGVSCPAVNACATTGDYINSASVQGTLAEHWDGTGWTIPSTPNAGPASRLRGVSCPAAGACTAVGMYGNERAIAEHWDGTSWTIQSTPIPSTKTNLRRVSCRPSGACTAVGDFLTGVGWVTLAERYP